MGGFSYTIEESIGTTETDMLRNKDYRTAPFPRKVIKLGIFVATLANLTLCRVKVGSEVVAEYDFPEGTAPSGDQALRRVDINVPPNAPFQVLITNTAATNTIFEFDVLS